MSPLPVCVICLQTKLFAKNVPLQFSLDLLAAHVSFNVEALNMKPSMSYCCPDGIWKKIDISGSQWRTKWEKVHVVTIPCAASSYYWIGRDFPKWTAFADIQKMYD